MDTPTAVNGPGPDPAARLERHAATVTENLDAQKKLWDKGFTRRRFVQGAGMVGAAALGSQLVTTKAAFAATPTGQAGTAAQTATNTVIVVFLRGACDSLRAVIPGGSTVGGDYLAQVRPNLMVDSKAVLPLAGGWAANPNMAPLMPFWRSGEMAFVPALLTDPSRSHFQACRFLETGGAPTGPNGWLDRLLTVLGPGTTFRAVASGISLPDSFMGLEEKIAVDTLANFTMPGWSPDAGAAAINSLYRGFDLDLTPAIAETIAALGTANQAMAFTKTQNGANYPDNDFAASLQQLAAMLRAEVGLQVATVDLGGWDTHTDEATDYDPNLLTLTQSLSAFLTDLGPSRRSRVTVVVMTEFGRRVAQNSIGGTDHGFGSTMWLLGGGLRSAQVAGKWNGLSAGVLDQGDVPGLNSPFDVLGELASVRLNAGSLSDVFPGRSVSPLGLFTA